jgi:N-acetylmuramoyl-L-alanine amidase
MNAKRSAFITAALAVLVVAGCQRPQQRAPGILANDQMVSVSELAARLGLGLDEQNDSFVVLKNEVNTVLIFTYADGRFFVNGQPLGQVGTVKRIAGTTYVSDTLVGQIQAGLGAAKPMQPQIPTIPRGTHVAIDPGHGGRDPGTIGVTGVYEKTINLAVAKKIAASLQREGLTVTMTRQDDRYPELEWRAEIANRHNVDLFVSIHCDSAPNAGAQGFTIYVADAASADTLRAARVIGRSMATTGLDNRGINRENLRVLVRTESPAVLIELGYLSNAQEAAKLQSSAFQDRLATAIASGIADYFR